MLFGGIKAGKKWIELLRLCGLNYEDYKGCVDYVEEKQLESGLNY